MRIALLHYHHRTGGVTRVIESQARALTLLGHEVIIPRDIDGLDYLTEPHLSAAQLRLLIEQAIGEPADLWIIHNPTLGKNILFPGLIASLAKSDVPLLLQCHDFAEDGRPSNYQLLRDHQLYPLAPHVHYAFINQRDRKFLIDAGIPADRCHSLPNALPATSARDTNSGHPLVFYPVRGIRRKNLGELCLWASHAPPGTRFAVARAPENPEWLPVHDEWQSFAAELNLPIDFDVVDSPESFDEWLGRASHIATTSIAEGFGLTFLEPHLLRKPLLGRDLPEITSDFKEQGLNLGHTYSRIPVPFHLLDLEEVRNSYLETVSRTYQAYGRPAEPNRWWDRLVEKGHLDFGNLPEEHQRHLIRNHHLPDFAAWLKNALNETSPVPQNLASWSEESYRNTLSTIIQTVSQSPPGPVSFLPKEHVLDRFLSPERFHFLRA
ncbi:MAG: hypothetical protein ACSHYF_18420 [Verrucomicrobiaceae bacterium]